MRVSTLLRPLAPSALIAATAIACGTPEQPLDPVQAGAPHAGAAERTLDLPVGTPLGGYSSRSLLLGGDSRPDRRRTAYNVGFVPSAGVQTRPTAKALWLHNDHDHLVLLKVDLIYSNDHYVQDVANALSRATGHDLSGRVVISASHSHQSYGPFSDQFHFYLGGDKFNPEIYARLVEQTVQVALRAWEQREPVALGSGWARDWDPDDRVYRDRRGINDDLHVWDDAEPGYGKDPLLHMLRVDRLDGSPLALAFTFGIHGTAVGGDSPMLSTEASGHIELAVQEAFDTPVVTMHLQGSGGDASPAGRGRRFARLEDVGDEAVDGVLDLWEQTPTASNDLTIESAGRHIPQHHSQIQVTRDGAVDWRYAPLTDNPQPDERIYGDDGQILSPLDEFNAPYGAAFCGSDAPLIPAGNIGSEVFPYSACMDVELVSRILYALFKIDEGEIPLPLPETLKAGTAASLIGPLTTLTPGGEIREEPLYTGYFPGEPTGMYGEQFRRRSLAELDHPNALLVGYSQDHEGYLLIPEDWLLGGYEPNINVWGPLQAEHIMEGVLTLSADLLGTGVRAPSAVGSAFAPTTYPDKPLPEIAPDPTPTAGTWLSMADLDPEAPLWTPDALPVDLDLPEVVPRVQGLVQIAWEGGDAMVDLPTITVQRQVDGAWEPLRTHAGRPITDAFPDVLLTWTPDPLFPVDADQTHRWWAAWQPVDHVHDRAGLPLGTYRLHVQGARYTGTSATWPWATEPYELATEPFQVGPAALDLTLTDGGLLVSLPGPAHGFRKVHDHGDADGDNPLHGPVALRIDGEPVAAPDPQVRGALTFLPVDLDGATTITVEDAYGNVGTLALR